mmetsp:Transcript_41112/g.62480  ORF Transcript_41112/g.62480 Transcript_41112/m.62480 type:complete len:94 (-) Transcript_41112:297-578(-)
MSLGLNLALCYDLVLTLSSPFDVTRGRLKIYQLGTFSVAAVLTIFLYLTEDRKCRGYIDVPDFLPTSTLVFALSLSSYIMVGIYSIIFSGRRL